MSNTIPRTDPGALSAGTGLTFRTNLNADRAIVYGHTDALEAAIELLAAQYVGKGTIPGNTAVLTIDSPVAGRVYCPAGYMAVIGGVPVITTAAISQAYNAAITDHVFLVVGTDGVLSLRMSSSTTENANDLWIADVFTGLSVTQNPTGKLFARITAANLALGVSGGIAGTPTIAVGAPAGDVINVAIQLKDSAGLSPTAKHVIEAWLSDAAAGDVSATDPDGGIAIGSAGVLLTTQHTDTVAYMRLVTGATGAVDINITHSGTHTWYLNFEYQGRVYSSGAISFT